MIAMCSAYQPSGAAPISSTNQPVKSEKIYLPTADGAVYCSVPRALETDEVAEYVEHFRKAARNCIEAGMLHLYNVYCVSVVSISGLELILI